MDTQSIKKVCKKVLRDLLPHGIMVLYRRIQDQESQIYLKNKREKDREYIKNVLIDAFLQTDVQGEKYFDINGIYLPDIRNNSQFIQTLPDIIEDTLLFYLYFHDQYDKDTVRFMDIYMNEGPYCYTDSQNNFSVTVEKNDIVLDMGAWIGDFSAYAAHKGARVYAFEPSEESYKLLQKTIALNTNSDIIPIQSGLADSESSALLLKTSASSGNYLLDRQPASPVSTQEKCSNASADAQRPDDFEDSTTAADRRLRMLKNINPEAQRPGALEKVSITTVDRFVQQQGLTHVDFIKADIEGSERKMLRGATETLKNFAPKLALCTYHLPDDPEVLERIILEANPAYKIVHLRHKLFACVPGK